MYGFVDGAKVGYEARGLFRGSVFDLTSAGIGIRVNYKTNASIELEAARSIDTPYPGYRGGWRISVGWRLSSKR
jgi:hemolysin activation/secretion protein